MWRKWANRTLLVAVAGSVLLAASSGLDQPQALASAGDNTHAGVTLPPNQGPIGAQAAPAVSIVAPSSAIGDFGANNGNVWDMNSTADIVWRQSDTSGHQTALSQLEPGIVHGVTPQGSDLAIAFYTSSSTNLPSSLYHHLLYRLKIAAGPQPLSCATNGRVLYTTQWPDWLGHQKHTRAYSPEDAPMNCNYGNFCVYYMDLSRNDNDGRSFYYDTWSTNPSPWPTDSVKGFGMWPHEVWYDCSGQEGPSSFDIDYVYLTGDIVARYETDPAKSYRYQVNYNVSDPDGGSIVSTIRYQEVAELQLPANSPACDGGNFNSAWHDFSPIAQKTTNVSPSSNSFPNKVYLPIVIKAGGGGGAGSFNETYTLNFSDNAKFTDGKSYYLCIRVDDGTSQRYGVSSAPVIRAPNRPNFGPS